jgi:hypothetical protein
MRILAISTALLTTAAALSGQGRSIRKYRLTELRDALKAAGTLTAQAGAWEIPTKTQGLTVTANHFIYSTSYGVLRASPACTRQPSRR